MIHFSRLFKHLFATSRQTKKYFPASGLQLIEDRIAESEIGHSGQIRVVIETTLSPYAIWHQQSSRERAIEVFSLQKIWDTENNNGVLIYLLMADHAFEIIADRGVHQKVGDEFWKKVCEMMEIRLKNSDFQEGVLTGIHEIDQILRKFYPASVITPNELSDEPILI
jgi:uncharacterized membrane protein